jgi:hypothetical protein
MQSVFSSVLGVIELLEDLHSALSFSSVLGVIELLEDFISALSFLRQLFQLWKTQQSLYEKSYMYISRKFSIYGPYIYTHARIATNRNSESMAIFLHEF